MNTSILAAEDNETNQHVLRRQLTLLGYSVDIAYNGSDGLKRWEENDYDLIMTDLLMPKMDGYELAATIRDREAGQRRIPIIALTAVATKGEAQRCQAAGMDDYLSKPAQLAGLRSMLQKWLPRTVDPGPDPESPPNSSSPDPIVKVPVDISALKKLVGDDAAVISELLRTFRIDSENIATELTNSCINGHLERAANMAHTLKSSARTVGAFKMGELCADIESAAKGARPEALWEFARTLQVEIEIVRRYLESL